MIYKQNHNNKKLSFFHPLLLCAHFEFFFILWFLVMFSLQALEALNKKDLVEIRSFTRPPALVEKVLEAVMILRQSEPSWAEGKRQLSKHCCYRTTPAACPNSLIVTKILTTCVMLYGGISSVTLGEAVGKVGISVKICGWWNLVSTRSFNLVFRGWFPW